MTYRYGIDETWTRTWYIAWCTCGWQSPTCKHQYAFDHLKEHRKTEHPEDERILQCRQKEFAALERAKQKLTAIRKLLRPGVLQSLRAELRRAETSRDS